MKAWWKAFLSVCALPQSVGPTPPHPPPLSVAVRLQSSNRAACPLNGQWLLPHWAFPHPLCATPDLFCIYSVHQRCLKYVAVGGGHPWFVSHRCAVFMMFTFRSYKIDSRENQTFRLLLASGRSEVDVRRFWLSRDGLFSSRPTGSHLELVQWTTKPNRHGLKFSVAATDFCHLFSNEKRWRGRVLLCCFV